MINISEYIQEKLFIGKGYKPSNSIKSLERYDRMLIISADDKNDLRLYSYLLFYSFNDDNLVYYNPRTNSKIEKKVFLNSNAHYEWNDNHTIAVFLTKDEGMKFLEKAKAEVVLNGMLINNYFDSEDESFLDDNGIACTIWSDGVISDCKKELNSRAPKPLNEKLYIDKKYGTSVKDKNAQMFCGLKRLKTNANKYSKIYDDFCEWSKDKDKIMACAVDKEVMDKYFSDFVDDDVYEMDYKEVFSKLEEAFVGTKAVFKDGEYRYFFNQKYFVMNDTVEFKNETKYHSAKEHMILFTEK